MVGNTTAKPNIVGLSPEGHIQPAHMEIGKEPVDSRHGLLGFAVEVHYSDVGDKSSGGAVGDSQSSIRSTQPTRAKCRCTRRCRRVGISWATRAGVTRKREKMEMKKIKQLGARKPSSGGLVKANNLLKLVLRLRGNKPFHPKGIFRFKSYEEKEEWTRKMNAR